MKKGLVVLFIQFVSAGHASASRTEIPIHPCFGDTTALPAILSLPLHSFIGKPIDSLLSLLPSNYTSLGFLPTGIGYCRGVYQSYGTSKTNSCAVAIFVDNFQHLRFPNRTASTSWNMNLAGQEIISYIRVIKNNTTCLFGCDFTLYPE